MVEVIRPQNVCMYFCCIMYHLVGASQNTVDLLPKGKSWTDPLTPVEGHEAAYSFDGKTAVKVCQQSVRNMSVVAT